MPILNKELRANCVVDTKLEILGSRYSNIVMDEINNSLKRVEGVLFCLFKDMKMLDLSQYDIDKVLASSISGSEEGEESICLEEIKVKIVQGQNQNLSDNIRLIMSVVLKMLSEVENMGEKMRAFVDENSRLRDDNLELNKTVLSLNNEINRLLCEKYHLEESLKEKVDNCSKYKNSLNNSIKTMKKLYLENDYMSREISVLENQLVISKLRVAQHNEELEHIRILLKYYKNKVSKECLLSPAIEQMVKMEPCRVSLSCQGGEDESEDRVRRELGSQKETVTTRIKMQTNIGNILSRLLFKNGACTNPNTDTDANGSADVSKKVTKSTSPLYRYSPLNIVGGEDGITTPVNTNRYHQVKDEELLSTTTCDLKLRKEDDFREEDVCLCETCKQDSEVSSEDLTP